MKVIADQKVTHQNTMHSKINPADTYQSAPRNGNNETPLYWVLVSINSVQKHREWHTHSHHCMSGWHSILNSPFLL